MVGQTHVPPPKVMFLIDQSDSIPADFRGEQMGQVARAVAQGLLQVDPRTTFRSAGVNWFAAASFDDWTADLDVVAHNAATVMAGGSDIWRALADAARFAPTAFVVITDAATYDFFDNVLQTEPKPDLLVRVKAGPPAFILGVGNVDANMLGQLGAAGRLGSTAVTDPAQAVTAIRQAIESQPPSPYRITYIAPLDGPATRHVKVALNDRPDISVDAAYDVPVAGERAIPPALAGLYLEVDCGNIRARRTLAGVEPGTDPLTITQDDVDAVRAALFGEYTITVEAGVPSPAVQLDDAISMAISTLGFAEARNNDARMAALATEFVARPTTLHATSVPLDDADGPLTFEMLFRMTLHSRVERSEPGGKVRLHTGVDILPHTVFATVDPNPAAAFRTTARRTARLALAEKVGFPQSTAARLEGASLVAVPGSVLDALPSVDRKLVDRLAGLLDRFGSQPRWAAVDAAADPVAWFVDRRSGSLFGVLPDGSGGAEEVAEITRVFDQIDHFFTIFGVYNDVAGLAGFGGLSLAGGAWLSLEAAKLKKLGAATLAIATLEDGSDPDLNDILGLSDLACEILQGVALDQLPDFIGSIGRFTAEEVASLLSIADGLHNLAAGEGLVC
jgi:hypothetical protein